VPALHRSHLLEINPVHVAGQRSLVCHEPVLRHDWNEYAQHLPELGFRKVDRLIHPGAPGPVEIPGTVGSTQFDADSVPVQLREKSDPSHRPGTPPVPTCRTRSPRPAPVRTPRPRRKGRGRRANGSLRRPAPPALRRPGTWRPRLRGHRLSTGELRLRHAHSSPLLLRLPFFFTGAPPSRLP
jgi:hypothetical protein